MNKSTHRRWNYIPENIPACTYITHDPSFSHFGVLLIFLCLYCIGKGRSKCLNLCPIPIALYCNKICSNQFKSDSNERVVLILLTLSRFIITTILYSFFLHFFDLSMYSVYFIKTCSFVPYVSNILVLRKDIYTYICCKVQLSTM